MDIWSIPNHESSKPIAGDLLNMKGFALKERICTGELLPQQDLCKVKALVLKWAAAMAHDTA